MNDLKHKVKSGYGVEYQKAPNQAATLRRLRGTIPLWHLHRFDAEAKAYIEEMDRSPHRYKQLARELWSRIKRLRRKPVIICLPPMLPQRDGETVDEWVERIYTQGGYINADANNQRSRTTACLRPRNRGIHVTGRWGNADGAGDREQVLPGLE